MLLAADATPGHIYTRTRRVGDAVRYYTRPHPSDIPGTNRKLHGETPEDRIRTKLMLPQGHVQTGTYSGAKTGTYTSEEAYLLNRLDKGWVLLKAHTRARVGGKPSETSRFVVLPPNETLRCVSAPPAYPRASL